jgi:acrylyl-CoA reductase (NADPH)
MSFRALMLDKNDTGIEANYQVIDNTQLPEGDVIIDIDYSTLNYKDALAITGKAPVVRKYPMIPGIDFAGTVVESLHPKWNTGDKVLLNGWGIGETHWGGLAQKAKVKGDWLVALPIEFTSRQAMMIGTAGYTAMLCVMALESHGIFPEDGEILVTGANGGVGSISIAVLSKLGYNIVASTGRPEQVEYLSALGAASIIDRNELSKQGKPLAKERWAGVVDCLGSHTLANACATTKYGGIVVSCGLAQGMDLPMTVAPFILRNITLTGIDSVYTSIEKRQIAWNRLAKNLAPELLETIVTEIPLSDVINKANILLQGGIRGRIIVDVNN